MVIKQIDMNTNHPLCHINENKTNCSTIFYSDIIFNTWKQCLRVKCQLDSMVQNSCLHFPRQKFILKATFIVKIKDIFHQKTLLKLTQKTTSKL